ncbi:hypothetical protein CCACVL1_04004, partial [Corchorus capsularis]
RLKYFDLYSYLFRHGFADLPTMKRKTTIDLLCPVTASPLSPTFRHQVKTSIISIEADQVYKGIVELVNRHLSGTLFLVQYQKSED